MDERAQVWDFRGLAADHRDVDVVAGDEFGQRLQEVKALAAEDIVDAGVEGCHRDRDGVVVAQLNAEQLGELVPVALVNADVLGRVAAAALAVLWVEERVVNAAAQAGEPMMHNRYEDLRDYQLAHRDFGRTGAGKALAQKLSLVFLAGWQQGGQKDFGDDVANQRVPSDCGAVFE